MRYLFCIIHVFLLLSLVTHDSAQTGEQDGLGIIIDNTGSLRPQLGIELAIAKEIILHTKNKTSISLFGFISDQSTQKAKVAAGVECSLDRDLLIKQIDAVSTVAGQTTLLDAIKAVSERLGAAKPDECNSFAEKRLVILTDGEDRASKTTLKDLLQVLKESAIKVYAVGLVEDLSDEKGLIGESAKQKGKKFLKAVTETTGGKVVFVKNKDDIPKAVAELFQ